MFTLIITLLLHANPFIPISQPDVTGHSGTNLLHGSIQPAAFNPAADITTGSNVNRVTVYPLGVRIERIAIVALVRGTNEIMITPLQGNIDLESITVSVDGNVTVMSVIPVVNFMQSPVATAETDRLNRQKKDLELKIAFQENLVYVLNEEEQALKENRRIEGDPQLSGILYLRDVMDFYRQRLTEISTKRLEIRREISDLNDELRRVESQLAVQQRVRGEAVTEVKLLLDSPVEMSGTIRVSYFSGDAEWQPVYDIRVEDVNSPLKLQYKAGITQRTGENWNNVEISLSSSAPLSGQQSPVLNPWRIDFPRMLQGSNTITSAMNTADVALDEMVVSGYSSMRAAPPAAVVMDTPLSFNFEVPARYTVSGDGEVQQVVITEYDLDAGYTYLAIPKIEEKVWLQARISDWERLNLLNGRANLFLGSTYLGNSQINPSVLTDTLALNLGVDEGIIIDRTKADQYSSRSFLGGRVTQTLTWDIEVRNTKRYPVSIRLIDQIPVSNRREISVDMTETGGSSHNAETGELVWLMDIGPNQSQTVRFSYQVRHPSDEKVVLE